MKQHITEEQVNEVTPEQKLRIWEWWTPREEDAVLEGDPRGYAGVTHFHSWLENWYFHKQGEIDYDFKDGWFPQLSIGQMIEFLHDHKQFRELQFDEGERSYGLRYGDPTWFLCLPDGYRSWLDAEDEVCDALWEAVKTVLEPQK